MRLRAHRPGKSGPLRCGARAGFTLIEVMVASSIGVVIAAAAVSFLYFSARSFSGITTQTVLNAEAGNTVEFIQARVRYATSIAANTNGNILTLGFDTDYAFDSNTNGRAYDDSDYFERFKFVGVNTTNIALCKTNQLIYIPNTSSTNSRTLIAGGVRNLPGRPIFQTTNSQTTSVIRFGLANSYAGNRYQVIEVQAMGVPLNRPYTNTVIALLP